VGVGSPGVGVADGVDEGVALGVDVGSPGVGVGVALGVDEGVALGVDDGVVVGVAVGVLVGVGVGVGDVLVIVFFSVTVNVSPIAADEKSQLNADSKSSGPGWLSSLLSTKPTVSSSSASPSGQQTAA